MIKDGDCTMIGGAHLGYLKAFGATVAERRILRIGSGVYLILDCFRSRVPHRYEQYFHFAPGGSCNAQREYRNLYGRCGDGQNALFC